MEPKVNWGEIRNEYINGGISYRTLAAKHGVPYRTLSDRARSEGWVKLRDQVRIKTVSKTVDSIAKSNAKVDDRINRLANRLIDKLEKAVEELDMEMVIVKKTMKTGNDKVTAEKKTLERDKEGPVDRSGLQQLTGVLRDLKAILDVRSDLDRQEQEARIEKLRRDSQVNPDEEDETGVILLPPVLEIAQ